MTAGGQPAGFGTIGATGPPAAFQAPKPPARWLTFSSPMSCTVFVASAERQPLAQKKTKRLFSANNRLRVGALGVDPELQHAAWAGEGVRDAAVALAFARVAQVDEDDIVASVLRQCLGRLDRRDLRAGFREQLLVALLHRFDPPVVIARAYAFGPGRDRGRPPP